MKRLSTILVLLLFSAATAVARNYGQTATVRIWDNTTAPHSNGITTPEEEPRPNRLAKTSITELYIFAADKAKDKGMAVVICPGGGYARLSMDTEGYLVAQWLAANGITAAVLKYRMPNGHPEVPLEDAEQAIRIMRGLASGAEGYTSERVGIMGFSAGGHLAAYASTLGKCRPAFSVLFYPVITGNPAKTHKGTFDNLLREKRTTETEFYYSLQNQVTNETPQTLLLLSDDDRTVPPENSIFYYNALKMHGVKASMHIYPTGGHGWGIRDRFKYKSQWQEALLDWLSNLKEKATLPSKTTKSKEEVLNKK